MRGNAGTEEKERGAEIVQEAHRESRGGREEEGKRWRRRR
jgi:hypothetical protein